MRPISAPNSFGSKLIVEDFGLRCFGDGCDQPPLFIEPIGFTCNRLVYLRRGVSTESPKLVSTNFFSGSFFCGMAVNFGCGGKSAIESVRERAVAWSSQWISSGCSSRCGRRRSTRFWTAGAFGLTAVVFGAIVVKRFVGLDAIIAGGAFQPRIAPSWLRRLTAVGPPACVAGIAHGHAADQHKRQ